MNEIAAELEEKGETPFLIPLGASTPLGAVGLALGFLELVDQGHHPSILVHASSSGGTQAGLLAGAALASRDVRVIGVSADEPAASLAATVEALEQGVLDLAGSRAPIRRAEVNDRFVGEGYGIPTEASNEAQHLLARSEAIVVDHTYTAKAMAGLVALVREGGLPRESSILFWHTGGQVGALA
jgi:1-aminocyclopropane-1-carboxylate deaminase/D-cysteine desulfhydrase-like pyridoxal-dependent ACC family enzyme